MRPDKQVHQSLEECQEVTQLACKLKAYRLFLLVSTLEVAFLFLFLSKYNWKFEQEENDKTKTTDPSPKKISSFQGSWIWWFLGWTGNNF